MLFENYTLIKKKLPIESGVAGKPVDEEGSGENLK